MVLTNNNATTGFNTAKSETVITTTTSQAQPAIQNANIIKKDAVITNVMEKPILENVIEKKNVEVHHKNVVQEIHEQKIIEIQKQPVLQTVQQGTLVQQQKAATEFQEIGTADLGEQERLRLERLRLAQAPKITQQQGAVRQVQEGEVLQQVVRQEFIEHHVQPVITEVREQNIIQEVVHPVVRKIHEAPIIREVQSTVGVQQNLVQQTNVVQGSTLRQEVPLPSQREFVQGSTLQQGSTFQQTNLVQGSTLQQGSNLRTQQAPLMTGTQAPLMNSGMTTQAPLMNSGLTQQSSLVSGSRTNTFQSGSTLPMTQGAPLTSGGPMRGNTSVVTNTTANTGLNTTTATSGAPIQAEMSNIAQHENKVFAREGGHLTTAEQSNLLQHEKVVEQFSHGVLPQGNFNQVPGSTMNKPIGTAPLTTGTTTAPLTTGTTAPLTTGTTRPFNAPLDDTTQKPGLMGKIKGAFHHNK